MIRWLTLISFCNSFRRLFDMGISGGERGDVKNGGGGVLVM